MSKPGHRFTNNRPIAAYQHQTSSCISTTRPTPATLVERRAAHICKSTIPADDITHLAEDHIQPPRKFTYTFVIPAIKSSLLLYLLSRLLSLPLAMHTRRHLTKFICGVDALIGSTTISSAGPITC